MHLPLRARLPTITRPHRQARTEPIDDLRAKDLLRQKAITPRRVLGQWTVGTLSKRQVRRPAGCSARLFKAMNTDDPFLPPPDHLEPGPRPLYVANRFVRIDKANKGKGPVQKVEQKKKLPAWMEAMQRQREEDAANAAETKARGNAASTKAAKDKAAKDAAKSPAMAHTPAFGSAPAPVVDRTPPRPGPPQAGAGRPKAQRPVAKAPARPQPAETVPRTDDGALDRTPPLIAPSAPHSSGRVSQARSAPKASAGRTSQRPGASAPVDRTPPVIPAGAPPPEPPAAPAHAAPRTSGRTNLPARPATNPGAEPPGRPKPPAPAPQTRAALRPSAPAKAPEPARRPMPVKPAGPAVDRTPPIVAHAPKDSQGSLLRTNAEIQKARKAAAGVMGGVGANSTSAPRPAAPPRPVPVRAPPPPQVTAGPAAPPPGAPAEATPKATEAPPKPPPPRAPPSGGMDDLFGSPTEGRARIAPRVKKTVEAAPEEPKPAPAEAIDRRPPLIEGAKPPIDRSPPLLRDAAPPKSGPEPMPTAPTPAQIAGATNRAPAPPQPAAAKPPPTPPKPGPPPSGGLDDLFGGPTEGRPKMAPRIKKTAMAAPEEEPPKPAAAPTIDRAPPLIQNVDPKKLPK